MDSHIFFYQSILTVSFTPSCWEGVEAVVLIEHFMEHRAQDPSISILLLICDYMHRQPVLMPITHWICNYSR